MGLRRGRSDTQESTPRHRQFRKSRDNAREGNGRTQRILTEHIAEHAGYLLDWHRISPKEQNLVMTLAFEGELQPLHDSLERAVLPIGRGGSVDD